MTDLYEDFRKKVDPFYSPREYRDIDYTYFPSYREGSEFAFRDDNGVDYYRVPNDNLGINGVINSMASNVKNVYESLSNNNYFINPEDMQQREAGLSSLTEGANNIFNNSRAYADNLMNNGPYAQRGTR